MAGTTGRSTYALINDLLSRGHEFSFSQVMRVARMHLGAGGAGELPEIPWQERVRIRPDLSLAFPASDVARVERTGEDGADLLVTATFLGLYGTSSPLPNHYTEDLLDEAAADSSVSRDFLDILHQRLYHLYFQCWNKYRLFVRVAEEKDPQDLERLFCLIGFSEKDLRDRMPDPRSLLRYAGLFNQFPRSAMGLQTLLRDALGVGNLKVEQCVLRKAQIGEDQRTRLGLANVCLGVDTVLGSEVAERMGKFRVHIGPLSRDDFDSFLPGTPRHDRLATLISLYVTDPFDSDLNLIMAANEARPIRLGAPDARHLGLNTRCFSGETLGEVSAIFQIGHSAAADSPATAASEEFHCVPKGKGPSTLTEYYQEELARLRDLAAAYAKAHPALASMVTGNPADSGVQRLFEGVAFLNAHLQQKLDDDWPEIVHDIMASIEPNSLRQVPASTVIVFTPKPNCRGPQVVPVGTELKSVPVDGTACRFTTRYQVEIHPLALTSAAFSQPAGKPPTITLSLKITGLPLDEWKLKSLRLFLAGEYDKASNLYLVLTRYLKRIVIAPVQEGQLVTLDPTHVKPVGFDDSEQLFPSEAPGTSGHQTMKEFFILPEKFLFLDLLGWETWCRRGKGADFEIRFELDNLPFELHSVSREDFALFSTPAINVFKHVAAPISMELQRLTYPVVPANANSALVRTYSIEGVTGIKRETNSKIRFEAHNIGHPDIITAFTYHLQWTDTAIHDEILLSITSTTDPLGEIGSLSVDLACTNGELPERLGIGDVCCGTDDSPAFAEFSNLKPIARGEARSRGINRLWRQLSYRSMNPSFLDARILRAMLDSMSGASSDVYSEAPHHANPADGITEVRVMQVDRLIAGYVRRGWEITIRIKPELYVAPGDLYLFGAVLDRFLNGFASQSSFTKTVIVGDQGKRYEWPVKAGQRPLL